MLNQSINGFEHNGFKILHFGYEDKLYLFHQSEGFEQAIFISFEDMITSINSSKDKASFVFNDGFVEDAKSKPSSTKFIIGDDKVTVQSSGPDNKNKTKTVEETFSNYDCINFISDMLYKYMILLERDYRSSTEDNIRKSLRKKLDKVTKFLGKGFPFEN